jgi:predicted nucleic acid-binding protein
MPVAVDASVALAWALPDESSAYADAVLAVVERDGSRVPELWPREIANGLATAYLRRRITPGDEQASITALSHLSIEVERSPSALAVIRDRTAARCFTASQLPMRRMLTSPPEEV